VGGVEVFVHRLACQLASRGHEVTMFTFAAPLKGSPYKVVRIGASWIATNRVARIAVAPAILNRRTCPGSDVLHLHGDDWFFITRQLPTVRTLYGSALYEARSATSVRRMLSKGLVYPLEALASRLSTLSYDIGTPLPPGYQVHGSLALAVDRADVQHEVQRSSHPTVLFVGTWHGRKRGEFLAERFIREVRPRHPNAELLVVSDRCVEQPGITWIRFPTDEELAALYSRAWLLCSPSTYEGFGLPYLEAMQHGLPIVATPNPGALHLLGREGAGRLADDDELGAAIANLLGDAEARGRLAASGRRRVEKFTWERVVEQHENAYRLAIASY
jgi:glycosyltransferase involved in cell wall biosynthesis